ncbi:hypothetical protein [Brevibacterium sp.]|uniref:hypothetical protein n=1 Tax=Brevibacterium sp. TaxID=1701 RepID=UPI002634CF90|nr:hypothetical protein [Brevibacterium sp.]
MDALSTPDSPRFHPKDIEIMNCFVAAPSQAVASDWIGCSPTHLRRQLKELRRRFDLDTNEQLIVLATSNGAVDPRKVLPYSG